jgi:predicted transcriptional regulator
MWIDAEAHNKFLEDLLQEYAMKLDNKDKKIQKLKKDLRSIKEEIEYLRAHQFTGSVYAEPATINVPTQNNNGTFNLQLPTVEVSLEDNPADGAYHIVARIGSGNTIKYSYFLTKESLMSATDKIGMLTYLHKKVLEEMERQLKNSS